MALMDMEQAVLRKAQEEADLILNEARTRADARFERESARLRQEHEHRVAAARSEMESALEREISARETDDRLKILKVKNEIIDEIFTRTVGSIRSLPDQGYERWLKAQLSRVSKALGGRVAVNERDAQLMARLIEGLPDNPDLSLAAEPAHIKAGFLVQGEQVDLDFSVEVLLSALRESLSRQIATRLFEEETK